MGGVRLSTGLSTLMVAVAILFIAAPAAATDAVGLVDPATGEWHLRSPDTTDVSTFYYGNPGDVPFLGDWDCDGIATPGLFRTGDAFAYLRNSNSQGIADIRFFFGNPSDLPLAGDFNGDGCDTLSIYRPSEQRFYVMNALGENEGGLGAADYSFIFGNPGDKPVVGDWDGDGVDEVGLHRESTGFFYYRDTLDTGVASNQFYFGDPGDRFVGGDWGIVDGVDTPAVFRPANITFYFRHSNTPGNADSQFQLGGSTWLPVAGPLKPSAGSVDVNPRSLLLNGAGDSAQLSAVVRDLTGATITAPVTWTSDTPAIANVDGFGRVTAVALGQATVTASGGGASTAVLVNVADLADDAVQVDDSVIVVAPHMVGSPQPDNLGTLFQLTMSSSAAPSVGDIVVGSRESGVAGRVVTVSPEGSNVVVEFETVPLTEVFDAIEVDITEPLIGAIPRSLPVSCTAAGSANIGGLETLGARLENDLGLSSGAGIKVKTKWGVLPTGVRAHAHLVVEGGVDVILEGSLWLAPSVSGNAECTVTFARPEIPIWGPFVAVVELGAGVDLDMAANSDPLTADLRILVPFDTKLGFKWENGDLTGYDHLSIGSPQVDFDLGVPSGFNLEASAFVFGKAELEAATAGAPAGISIVEGRFGLQQSASLRDQTTQMTFPSRYWLSPHALVRPGDGVRTMLSWVGLGGSWTQGWEGDLGGPLAESPTGSLTPWSSDVAAGNTLLGTITLQSTNYLSGYNVDEVKVYGRPSGGGLVSQLGTTVAAGSGQVQFPWSWQPMSNQTGTWEIAAFVVTKGLPLVPLRVGDVELIEVTGTSNLPPVGVDDYYALSQGDLLSIGAPGVLGNDSDPEQAPISVAHLSDPAHGSLDLFTDGSFDYYHDGSAITNDAFTYTVTDGVNESSWITVHLTIDINDPPVVVDDHYTAGRGELLSVGAPGVLDNDWDPEGSSLLLAHHSLATHGTVSMGDDGSLSYSHDGSSATSDSFTYTVTDGVNESSPATVYLTIVGSGDVRVTLNWWSTADLDLYVTDPLGEIIYYGNSTSTSGGELDVDANFPCNVATTGPVENIYWPIGGAPQGEYVVEVRYAVECNSEGPQNIQVTTIVDGALRTHFQTLSIGQQIEVARFTR